MGKLHLSFGERRAIMECLSVYALILVLTGVTGKAVMPKKVAILGGGPASCTAALALTSQSGWKQHYDITIYQLGWRLGGKAASGRNKNYGQRIEEIGGHGIEGNYHNTKILLRSLYTQLNREEEVPQRTFDEAFVMSFISGKKVSASLDKEQECFSLKHLFKTFVKGTFSMIEMMAKNMNVSTSVELGAVNLEILFHDHNLLQSTVNSIQERILKMHTRTQQMKSLETEQLSMVDIAVTVIKVILIDSLLEKGFNSINHLDLRQWLENHGASSKTLNSTFLKTHYDLLMSYTNGDIKQPSIEAGTSLTGYLQFYFCFDDVVYFDQQGGLGDVIFAPVYQVLKTRGVNFKFFHKVEELSLNNKNPKLIEQIKVTKQLDVVKEEYDPLINVKGLPSWPNEPKYDEIDQEQAKLLQKYDIDLENFWTIWPNIYKEHSRQSLPEVILKRGEDFDIIIFGIPIGSLPYLCSELLEASPSLRYANKYIGRIPSIQLQLYIDVSRENLQPKMHNEFLFSNREGADYIVTDNDPNLMYENWESLGMNPKFCRYLTIMKNSEEIPSIQDTWSPHQCRVKNRDFVVSRTPSAFKDYWPNAYKDGDFNWDILTDP